jgi:sialic acid synthase SpsE
MTKLNKLQFIAEAALGHEGSLIKAKNYVLESKKLKTKFLKFHILIAEEIADIKYKHYKLFKSYEMKKDKWVYLSKFAKKNKISLIFDILGEYSLKIAELCGAKMIKIHSTDMYNYPLHKKINLSKIKQVIVSVGGCTNEEIFTMIKNLNQKKIILMYGYQIYPTTSRNLRLLKIKKLKEKLKNKNIVFGYADHSPNGLLETVYNCSSSIAMGATIIEKHYDPNPEIKKKDEDTSAIDTNSFNELIYTINICKPNIGKNIIWLDKDESKYRKSVSRSFFSKGDLKKDSKFTFDNITLKRGKTHNKLNMKELLKSKTKIFIKNNTEINQSHLKK